MKKLLFIIWTFSMGGGAEKVLAEILNGIDTQKYDVTILEYHKFDMKKEVIPPDIKVLPPIIVEYNGTNKMKLLINKLKVKFARVSVKYFPYIFRKLYIKDKYDVEIAFNYMIPTFLLSKQNNVKKIAWNHCELNDLDYNKEESKLKKLKSYTNYKAQKKAFNNCDEIVTISEKNYKSFCDVYPEMKYKSKIIYNGFDLDKIERMSYETVDLPTDKPLILSVGRMDANKNQKLILDAALLLKQKGYSFNLVFAGTGEDEHELKKYCNSIGMDNDVIWIGYVNNPYPYVKRADILAITSYNEGFPTVAIEALRLKAALVSTDVAGIREITDNYKYCKVAEWNAVNYAEKIEEVLVNLNNLKHIELLEEAKRYVGKFTITNQLEKLYEMIK